MDFIANNLTLVIFLFIVLGIFLSNVFIVKQQTAVIVERLGKFHSVRKAGLNVKIPFIDSRVFAMNLRIQQLDVNVETKSKDDVFVKTKISVQYQVLEHSVYKAFYELQNPQTQLTSYIFDVVRAEVPKMKLDDVFEKKDNIAIAIKQELQEAMEGYGYFIVKALVTDIDPAEEVKDAMNRINAAERAKIATEYEAKAEKIKIVARAEAEAESKKLQGQGIADQRREIARGLEESVKLLNGVNIGSQEASALIVVTQHYDTLQSIGASTKSNLILLPNSPSAANDMMANTIASFVAAKEAEAKL